MALRLLLFLLLAGLAHGQLLKGPGYVASLKPPTAGASSPQPDIVWWKMNENGGTTVADASTRGTNTLTLSSASMWTTGQAGSGITGNGSSFSAASTYTLNPLTNVITLSYWFNDAAYAASLQIIAELGPNFNSQNGFIFYLADATHMTVAASMTDVAGRVESFTPPSAANWHHYLIVYDPATPEHKVYIDGSSYSTTVDTAGGASAQSFENDIVYLLARFSGSFWSDGALDDVRIYSGDRSANVAAIYADPQ